MEQTRGVNTVEHLSIPQCLHRVLSRFLLTEQLCPRLFLDNKLIIVFIVPDAMKQYRKYILLVHKEINALMLLLVFVLHSLFYSVCERNQGLKRSVGIPACCVSEGGSSSDTTSLPNQLTHDKGE